MTENNASDITTVNEAMPLDVKEHTTHNPANSSASSLSSSSGSDNGKDRGSSILLTESSFVQPPETESDTPHINSNSDNSAKEPRYKPKWGSSNPTNAEVVGQGSAVTPASVNLGDDFDDDTSYSNNSELPAFADASNKALHEETKRLELLRQETERAVKTHRERVEMMEEHLHDVRQEIEHTDGLMAAKKKEIDTEQHLLALSERESSRYNKEIKEASDEANADKHRFKAMQSQIISVNEETEKLKLALNWNQEELEQWAAAAARKEEDNLALQRYARADEAKIKELSLTIENLTKLSVKKRALLENETKQTASYQMELDRIADVFKAQHGERKEFVKQWQDTIATMRVRDEEIGRLSTQYAQVESALEEQMSFVAKNREALALLEIDKNELEQNAEAIEREVLFERHELLSAKKSKESFVEELDALRIEMIASAQSLQKKVAEQKVTQNELEQKKMQLVEFRGRYDAIKARLEDERKATMSQERAVMEIEKQLDDRRKEVKQKDQLLQSLQDKLFKHSRELDSLRKAEADIQVDITSAQGTYKNLSSTLKDLQDKHARQQEILYNTEFDLQQMERKVARGLGERSDEEKLQLQARIKQLEQDLEAQRNKRKSLAEQRKKVQVELQNWAKRKQERTKQQDIIHDQLIEIELEINACETSLDNIVKDREEAMIAHDVVRLDVRSLRDTLRSRAEEVYSLEDRRDEIKSTIIEKKEEIKTEADVKSAQIRAFEEERHKCAIELNNKNLTVKNLQGRYFHLSDLRRSQDGDGDGEEHSQVYYLIAAAQKREELQREGDELDRTIRQKEKESQAMANTLQALRKRNAKYRSSLSNNDNNKACCSSSGDRSTKRTKQKKTAEVKPLRVVPDSSHKENLKSKRIEKEHVPKGLTGVALFGSALS